MVFGKHFAKYYLKYCYFFILGIAILVVTDWIQLDVAIMTGQIIDILSSNSPNIRLEVIDLLQKIIYIIIFITIARFFWRWCIFGTSRQIEYELRKVMFDHALKLGQTYYSHHKVGAIMTYFVNDLNAIRDAFGPGILTLVDGIFMGIFALYRMYLMSPFITLFALLPIIVILFLIIIANNNLRRAFKERLDSYEDLSDYIQETYSGISVVKAFIREIHKILTFDKKSEVYQEKTVSYLRKMVFRQVIVSVSINVISILIIVLGSLLIIQSKFTAGQLTSFISLYLSLLWPMNAITRFLYISSQASASSKRLNSFLDEREENPLDGTIIPDLKGDIVFNDLTFKYPDSEVNSLANINLTIKEGEFIGIIGKTGSGKTTLVETLSRIYPIESNKVFINGVDITSIRVSSLRDQIGYVPQDNFLYSEKIKDNIAFSDSEVNEEKVIASSKLADIDENISTFNEGYNTVLGERGVTVSGGQKQRISIARALYKDPNILILDDSISAVDTKTEETIISNLLKTRKGKTTILIAHRITTIKKLDKIVVFEDSKIDSVGTYDELIEKSTIFKDIVRRQELENLLLEQNK